MAVAVRQERSVAGHEAGRLFEAHSGRILGYCLRYLGNRAEAEDAVQTTYLYAHRALERGVVPESEYVWLHSIAKNVCRWQQRTSLRRDRLVCDESADTVAAPEVGDGDTELLMGLQDALASIPESQRHALLLREWQGLSCDEVASKLGTSRAATNALLTRARRSLAKAMTAVPQLPALGLDFGSLFVKLKALVAGGTAKVAATTLAVAGIAAGGVVAERTIVERDAPQPGRAGETLEPGLGSSSDVPRVVGTPSSPLRRSALIHLRTPRRTPATELSPSAGPTTSVVGTEASTDLPGGVIDTRSSPATPAEREPRASDPEDPDLTDQVPGSSVLPDELVPPLVLPVPDLPSPAEAVPGESLPADGLPLEPPVPLPLALAP